MKLIDRVAVITGGSRGLGKAIAKAYLTEGATVIITARNPERLRETEAELKPLGRIEGVPMDVSKFGAVQDAMARIIDRYGHVDILVNNAGIPSGSRGSGASLYKQQAGPSTSGALLVDMTEEQFDRVIAVNLKGVFACARAIAGHMTGRGYGRIINMSSVTAHNGSFGQTNYAATKAGIIVMTQTWAKELGNKGVTVNAVAPGYTATEMIGHAPAEVIGAIEERTPLKRLGTPEEMAAACVYLASDDGAFVNGAVLNIDGGIVL